MKSKFTISISAVLLSLLACATTYVDIRSKSNHFKSGQFLNLEGQDSKSFWTFLKMRISTEWPSWPEWIESTSESGSSSNQLQIRNESTSIHLTHINHSTVLLQSNGLNILTDPIYSERCSPVSFAGPKRVRKPGIEFANLPKIDFVLISHDHYDHLDLETIKLLIERDHPTFFVGLGVGKHFPENAKVIEMDWWQTQTAAANLKIHFVPVQHFSGRGLFDRNSTLWGGFFIEVGSKKIYFGGDTGYAGHFTATKQKYGESDLAILPIGAYAPRDFMKFAHIDPSESVKAHLDLGAKKSFGVHYGTFQLTAEPVDEPIRLLAEELKKQNLPPDSFVTSEFGKTLIFE